MKPQYTGLVGDVGGTNARFALIDTDGRVRHLHIYPAANYTALRDIIDDYLERTLGRGRRPPRAVIAVAGPVLDGEIEFTNLHWVVSTRASCWRSSSSRLCAPDQRLRRPGVLACPMLGSDALKPPGSAAARAVRLPHAGAGRRHRLRGRRPGAQRARRRGGLHRGWTCRLRPLRRRGGGDLGPVPAPAMAASRSSACCRAAGSSEELYGVLAEMKQAPPAPLLPHETGGLGGGEQGRRAGKRRPSTASAESWVRSPAIWR